MSSETVARPGVERLAWQDFLDNRFGWRQGEHVSLIGPTGAGKTTLALGILPLRNYVIAIGTKPTDKDETLGSLLRGPKAQRWRLVKRWDAMPKAIVKATYRVVFWPTYRTPDDEPEQSYQVGQLLRSTFTEGSWCIYVDEAWWLGVKLGLTKMLESLWSQGRSLNLTLVAGTQRPAHVPLMMYDQATHLFFWRDNDERNLKRISGLNGLNARLIRETVATLDRHAVLYVNTRTGYMATTTAPRR